MDAPHAATKVRFFLMVDHLEQSVTGKLILVGTFDKYLVPRNAEGKIVVGGGWVTAQIDSSLAFGTEQQFNVDCVTEDETPIMTVGPISITFHPRGAGRLWRGTISARIGAVEIPDYGEYAWRLKRDGEVLETCPFDVAPIPEG